MQDFLLWGFIGLYVGQIADRSLEGGRWHGYYGDLLCGIVGAMSGGVLWIWQGKPENLLGALLYGIIGSLGLLLLLRVVGQKQPRQGMFRLQPSFEDEM